MTEITLVATDMDGTLLDGEGAIPSGFEEWVLAHPQVRTVIASGRQVFTLMKQFEAIQDALTFIADNGAVVVEHGKLLHKNVMARESLEVCIRMLSGIEECVVVLCGLKSAYIGGAAPESARASIAQYYERRRYVSDLFAVLDEDEVVKIALYFEGGESRAWAQRLQGFPPELCVVASSEQWIDIANCTVNKGSAIRAVQERCGISPAACMAFGDYLNDIELLQSCGESYCMENGAPQVKAVAKHVAPPNTENGVMRSLLRVIG